MQFYFIVLLNRKNLLANMLNFIRKFYIIMHSKFKLDIIHRLIKCRPFQWPLSQLMSYDIPKHTISWNTCFINIRYNKPSFISLTVICIGWTTTNFINTEFMQSCNAHNFPTCFGVSEFVDIGFSTLLWLCQTFLNTDIQMQIACILHLFISFNTWKWV